MAEIQFAHKCKMVLNDKLILYPKKWSATQTSWSDTITVLNNGVRGQTIHLFLASTDSEHLSSPINSDCWSARENPHCLLRSRASTKNNVVHPHYTDSLTEVQLSCYPSSSGSWIHSKWKRAPIKLWRWMPCLQCIIHAERKRDCVWVREKKQAEKGKTYCPLWKHTPLFQSSRNPSICLLVKSN